MRATYTITRLGRAGAVRLPKVLGIRPGDSVEIFFENGDVAIQKYVPRCVFCNNPANGEFCGKNICSACVCAIRKFFTKENSKA